MVLPQIYTIDTYFEFDGLKNFKDAVFATELLHEP